MYIVFEIDSIELRLIFSFSYSPVFTLLITLHLYQLLLLHQTYLFQIAFIETMSFLITI